METKSKKGFLLYDPNTKNYFFRQYRNGEAVDFALRVEDLEIEISDDYVELIESEQGNQIAYKKRKVIS